jgi:integrase
MAETPVAANRVYKITRRMFGWAIEHDLAAASPCVGMKAPFPETARDRVLTDHELLLIWQAAGELGGPGGLLVQLLTLTGQRRSEVAGMTWAELDLDQGTWTLPAVRVKTGKLHAVPLSGAVLELLQAAPRIGAFVVSMTGARPVSGFSEIKDGIAALLPPDMPAWVFHDLRRTAATGMARLGIGLPVIEKVLNHASGSFGGIVGVYQRHDFANEKRAALDAWARHVTGLASGNVIALRA